MYRSAKSALLSCTFLLALLASVLLPAHQASAQPVRFVDWSWDSAQFHNRVAAFIIEHGYGYEVDFTFADTIPGLHAMIRGDLDVSMEMWPDNYMEIWIEALNDGSLIDLGSNFPDSPQGWYVPTYLIEGDPERGIAPLAPELRSVRDLPKYWELFTTRESRRKGRFYNCPTGWACHDINKEKLAAYGLDEYYDAFSPGSQSALSTSIAAAYERGEPWLGYYWEPTYIMGLYDMTLLEEPEYSESCWEADMGCAYPASKVLVAVTDDFAARAPELVAFLDRYETELKHTNEALAYMNQTGGDVQDAAYWFLRKYDALWSAWVSDDVAERVRKSLEDVI